MKIRGPIHTCNLRTNNWLETQAINTGSADNCSAAGEQTGRKYLSISEHRRCRGSRASSQWMRALWDSDSQNPLVLKCTPRWNN
jgi:hypothetical protein